MPSLRAGLQALIQAPGSITKSELVALLRAHAAEPHDTIEDEAGLIALESDAVLRSEGGSLYNKISGPGEGKFHEVGNRTVHDAADISLPATLLSDGSA